MESSIRKAASAVMDVLSPNQPESPETVGRNVGRIEEIQGVVIEAVFPDMLPEINNAIVVEQRSQSETNDPSLPQSGQQEGPVTRLEYVVS